jgi:hypothetical protein
VDAPHAEPVAQHKSAPAATSDASGSQAQAAPPKKKNSFWTRLKHAFGGGNGPGQSPNS